MAQPSYPPSGDPAGSYPPSGNPAGSYPSSVNPVASYPPSGNPVASYPMAGYPPAGSPVVNYPPACNPAVNYPPAGNPVMNYPPASNPVVVVSPQFCSPYNMDLTIVRKIVAITEGNFAVTDVNGNVMFRIKGKLLSLRDRRVLLDAAGNPLLTLQQKILSAHRRWQVYRGESTDPKDLLFSVKKSSLIQFSTQLDVILAANTEETVCDFKIKGDWFKRACIIYLGNTTTIIAQMHRKHNVKSVALGKDTFAVTVYPNVDYAFIVALVVVLEGINEDRDD